MENVKMPMEAGMLCTIDGETFHLFMKNTWIWDSDTSCQITNNDTSLFDITTIKELVQGSLDSLPAIKKGKFCFKAHQVDGTEWVHTLLPMKFCPEAGANLFSLRCKLLQGNTIKRDHKNNIIVHATGGDIILCCCIKNCDNWVPGVEFLWEKC